MSRELAAALCKALNLKRVLDMQLDVKRGELTVTFDTSGEMAAGIVETVKRFDLVERPGVDVVGQPESCIEPDGVLELLREIRDLQKKIAYHVDSLDNR